MTRAAFNTTCDIYSGPGSATPGAFVGTFDCRLVVQDAIFVIGLGAPFRLSYITIAGIQPVGVWTAGPFGADAALADRIAVPSGTPPQWWVLYTESVLWLTQPIYWRANLVPLPAPHSDCIAMESSGLVMQEDTSYILLE